MIKWIGRHKTWMLFLLLGVLSIGYIGYTNVWEPVSMIEDAKVAAGETVNLTKDLIEFIAQKDILDLLKVLIPLIPIILTWRRKSKMDTQIKQGTNKVVRGKMGLWDRRKVDKTTKVKKRSKDKVKKLVKKVKKKLT